MRTTSHFIGLKLRAEYLADLFVDIYKLLEANGVLDCVVFQNLATVHITLCYLDEEINRDYFRDRLREFKGKVCLDRVGSFNDERIFYLGCEISESLLSEYEWYQEIFMNDAVDTDLDFIPHVTLFRVVDRIKFGSVRNKVLRLVEDYIERLEGLDLNDGIGLFAVNSKFQPELQVEIG